MKGRERGLTTQREGMRGFSSILAAVLLFMVCIVAVTLLASLAMRTGEREASTGSVNKEIYQAIVGNPELGTFGYIGDVGDYPDNLADLLKIPSANPPGWNGPYLRDVPLNSNGILMDTYFGPLEYFRSIGIVAEPSTHGVVIISRGPDHVSSNTSASPNDSTVSFVGTNPTAAGYTTTPDNVDNHVVPDIYASSSAINFGYTGALTVNLKNWDTTSGSLLDGCPMAYTMEVTSDTRGANDRIAIAMGSSLSMQLVQGLYTIRLAANSNTNQSFYTEAVAVYPGVTTTRNIRANNVTTASTPSHNLRVTNQYGSNLYFRRTIPGPATDLAGPIASGNTSSLSVNACGVMEAWTGAGGTGSKVDTWVMTNSSYTRVISNTTHTVTISTDGAPVARRQVLLTLGTVGTIGIPVGTVYKLRRKVFTVPRNTRIRTFDNTGNQLDNVTAITSDQNFAY